MADVTLFGTVGDGVTDDTTAIANAAAANQTLDFPEGQYRVGAIDLSGVECRFAKGAQIVADTAVTLGSVAAGLFHIFAGDGTYVLTRPTGRAFPEWFGALGLPNDDSAAIQKCHDACLTNQVLVELGAQYGIGAMLAWNVAVPVWSHPDARFTRIGEAVDGLTISDGNMRGPSWFPRVIGFPGFGVKVMGTNVAQLHFPTIESCGDGLVLETVYGSHNNLLDSEIYVHQIGLCDRGVVWSADHALCGMQGNRVEVNFINETRQAVVFANHGLGAATPGWDSNVVRLQAIDPTPAIANARGLLNENTDPAARVYRLTFRVESWIGGFPTDGKYVDGGFSDLDLYLNVAQAPLDGQISIHGGSNRLDVSNAHNKADPAVTAATANNSKASFNGGVPLWHNRVKINFTPTTNWPADTTRDFYIYHALTDRNSNRLRVVAGDTAFPLLCTRISDDSGTRANEIRITLLNVSGTAITAGTARMAYVEVGV